MHNYYRKNRDFMLEWEINHRHSYTVNNYPSLIRDCTQSVTNYNELTICKLHEMCSIQNSISTGF